MITDSMNLYELPEFLHDSSLLHKHEFSPYQSTYQSRLMYVRIKIPVWYWFVTQDYLKLLLLCTVSHFFKQQLLPTLSNIILYTAWSHPRLRKKKSKNKKTLFLQVEVVFKYNTVTLSKNHSCQFVRAVSHLTVLCYCFPLWKYVPE